MLSPSSLFTKIIGVLARNGGGKWNQTLVGSMSLLNMALVCIRVGLGTFHFIICLPSWVWVISFDDSSSLCHVTMTSNPLMSNTAKSSVVLPICSRELFPLQFSTSFWFSVGPDSLSSYSSVSYRWCGKHLQPGYFLSTSAHSPGSWSRDSLLVP